MKDWFRGWKKESTSETDPYLQAENAISVILNRGSVESSLKELAAKDSKRALKVSALILHDSRISPKKHSRSHNFVFSLFCNLLPEASVKNADIAISELNDLFGRALSETDMLPRAKFYSPNNPGYGEVTLGHSALTAKNVDELYSVVQRISWPESVNLGTVDSWYEAMKSKRR